MVAHFPVTLRACLHGGGGGNPPVHIISHFSLITFTDMWGDQPRRVAWSARPGNPLSRGQFCHVNVSRWGKPPSRDRIHDTSNSRKIHFGGDFASSLKVTIQSLSTEGCSKNSKCV